MRIEMPDVKWIKITTEMFDDEKIKLIESMPDKDSILIIWIKLLVQAGKCNATGYIYLNETLPYTDEMLSTIFNRPLNTVRLALSTFQKFGMIELLEDGKINIINWEKHQNIKGLEQIREQTRARVQKCRERKKLTENVTKNVTLRNATELEENKNKNKKKLILRESDFETFYQSYPVKKSKQAAVNSWKKLQKSGDLPEIEIILAAVKNQAAERIRKKQAGQFCPEWKHPATWLNQKCWEDETGDSQSDIEARLTDSGYDRVTGKYMTENGEPRVCL
jgi:predicted phage replisome organizer